MCHAQLQDCMPTSRSIALQAGFQLRQPRGADVTRLVSGSLGDLPGFAR